MNDLLWSNRFIHDFIQWFLISTLGVWSRMIKAKLNRKKCQLIHGPGRVHFTLVIRDFELRCYGNISVHVRARYNSHS